MAALAEAVNNIVEYGIKPVMKMLLVDMATRGEVTYDGQRIVGYWVGKQVRIDIKEVKRGA